MSCTLTRSVNGMLLVIRGSSETKLGRLKVSRPSPGERSVRLLLSVFRSEFTKPE